MRPLISRLAFFIALSTAAAAANSPDGGTNRDPHGPPRVDAYIRELEAPEREVVKLADRIVALLHFAPNAVVADIGCGPGVVSLALARALSRGFVYAVDVEPAQLDRLNQRIREEHADRIAPVLAVTDDPRLPSRSLDGVVIIDTYHHLDDRPRYLAHLTTLLKPGARVAIVDWDRKPRPVGPPAEHVLPRATVLSEMKAAGFTVIEEPALSQYQYFLVFRTAAVK